MDPTSKATSVLIRVPASIEGCAGSSAPLGAVGLKFDAQRNLSGLEPSMTISSTVGKKKEIEHSLQSMTKKPPLVQQKRQQQKAACHKAASLVQVVKMILGHGAA